jgi:hypothetical protein
MISNDREFDASQARIAQFQEWLRQMRKTARREEFESVTGGYRLEIERMQAEVLDYLLRPVSGVEDKSEECEKIGN